MLFRPLLGMLVLGVSLLVAGPLRAHALSVAHLDITRMPDGNAMVEVDLAIRDLALSFPLDVNRDERVTWRELRAIRRPLEQWIASGLSLSTDAGLCTLEPRGLATRHYDDGVYATVQMDARCPSTSGMRVRYGLLFALDPRHRALVTLRQGGVVGAATIRAEAREVVLGDAPPRAFADFLREGVHHILIGYDHIAFLLSLLLPAALLRRERRWLPAAGLRRVVAQTLGIVTAFTVAHSITLSLAALGWVTPASHWIEPAIAMSVLLVAINNVHPLVTSRAWMVGFGFGLIHGFGFAGALGELGLPSASACRRCSASTWAWNWGNWRWSARSCRDCSCCAASAGMQARPCRWSRWVSQRWRRRGCGSACPARWRATNSHTLVTDPEAPRPHNPQTPLQDPALVPRRIPPLRAVLPRVLRRAGRLHALYRQVGRGQRPRWLRRRCDAGAVVRRTHRCAASVGATERAQ